MNRVPFWHEIGLAILAAGLLVWAGVMDPVFVRPATQLELSTHVWEMAILALPMMLIVITAGIDLSLGSTMALCAVVLGLCYEAGFGLWVGGSAAVVTGLAAGALNGFFVAWVGVHPLIVTLATMAAFRGIGVGISAGRPISGFPEGFKLLGQGDVLGLPIPGLVFVVGTVIVGVLLSLTVFGRNLYAIGHNERCARFSGTRVRLVKWSLYTGAGFAAAVCAILYVARRNTAKADIGTGLELDVVTAVVLGGCSIFGGRGNLGGTLLGIFLIHQVREFVSWQWNRDELVFVVVGTLLIFSVLLHRFIRGRHANP
jgi:rhamnose transport system permease protein